MEDEKGELYIEGKSISYKVGYVVCTDFRQEYLWERFCSFGKCGYQRLDLFEGALQNTSGMGDFGQVDN